MIFLIFSQNYLFIYLIEFRNVVTLPEVRDEPANIDDGDMADDAADPRGEVIQKRRRIKVPKSVRKKIKRQEKFGLASSMKE